MEREMGDNPVLPAEYVAENFRLRGLIKVLCSDPSPFGSEAFQRTRDTVNPEYRALLLAVLTDGFEGGVAQQRARGIAPGDVGLESHPHPEHNDGTVIEKGN